MFLAAVPPLGIPDVILRFLCAMLVGMVIGTEREYTHRPAGMRTHILVALGSCCVMVIGQMIFHEYAAYGATPDPARLAAQVITGVGFLGAGTILREGANVKGLTTAASLWSVACLGIASGAGYYIVALTGMVLIFVTLTVFESLQNKLVHTPISCHYTVKVTQVGAGLASVRKIAETSRCTVEFLSAEELAESGGVLSVRVSFRSRKEKHRQLFIESLMADSNITAVTLDDPVHAN